MTRGADDAYLQALSELLGAEADSHRERRRRLEVAIRSLPAAEQVKYRAALAWSRWLDLMPIGLRESFLEVWGPRGPSFDVAREDIDGLVLRRAGRAVPNPEVRPISTHDVLASLQVGRSGATTTTLFDETRDFLARASTRLGEREAILALVRLSGEEREYFGFEQTAPLSLLLCPLHAVVFALVFEAERSGFRASRSSDDTRLRAGATEHLTMWLWVRRAWFGEVMPPGLDMATLERKGILRPGAGGIYGAWPLPI